MNTETLPTDLNKLNIPKIVSIFDEMFPTVEAPLDHRNAFELLIAVMLSAQCTDERVNTITPILFKEALKASGGKAPCMPSDILALGESRVREIIRPTGYYNSKTKGVMGTSLMLNEKGAEYLKKYGEVVPSTLEELTALPGVGGKTAQVIQSQWFKLDAFPVDTHIHRICNRMGLADSGKNRDKTEKQVKAIIPKEHWSKLHLQIIFHGRKTCTAYKPKCGECPLFKECQWGEKEDYS